MTTGTNTLAQRIAKASQAIGGALKADKRHVQQNYDYISADKILDRVGQVLAENGVAVIPAITATTVETYQTSGGKGFYNATVTFAMTLTDGDTTLEFPWVGMGTDYSTVDKALYKAITSGHKYFLVKLLNIGAGNEDGEHEAPPAENSAPPQRQQAPKPPNSTPRQTPPPMPPPAEDEHNGNPFTEDEARELRKLNAIGTQLYGKEWDGKRHELAKWASKGRTESSKQLTLDELRTLTAKLDERQKQAVPA